MNDRESKRYLVHIRLGEENKEQSLKTAALLKEVISDLSESKIAIAYSTPDLSSFGVLMKSKMHAHPLRAAIDGSGNKWAETRGRTDFSGAGDTGFRDGDSIMVMEVGEDFSCLGFGNPGTWLQRN